MSAPLYEIVGFDYASALAELNKRMTYDEICRRIGYQSKSSIYKILRGTVPAHNHGEALWALYLEKFHVKPPLTVYQSAQLIDST